MKYSSGKYTAKVTSIDLGLFVFRDSVAMIYDAAGKVITERSYTDFGSGYEETGKVDYTYSGSNIASINPIVTIRAILHIPWMKHIHMTSTTIKYLPFLQTMMHLHSTRHSFILLITQ
jgi:hypothetical protein